MVRFPSVLTRAPRLLLILSLAIIAILYCLYLASTIALMSQMRAAGHITVMTVDHELPQSDYALFWYAGKLLWVQMNLHFGHPIALASGVQKMFSFDILAPNAPVTFAWPYPPPMTLLVVPFSFLPLAAAFWVWRAFSVVVALFVLRKARLGWLVICAGLASPAALHDLTGGQDGTLVGSLLVAALLLIEKRPLLAGGLAGLLCMKPQVAVGLPSVLLHKQFKTAFFSATATFIFIAALTTALQGWEAWVRFFEVAQPDSVQASAISFDKIFPAAGTTVFLLARSLHATVGQAALAQGISSIMALLAIFLVWNRDDRPITERMALTVCLSILAAPHGFAYDLVAFSIAMAALVELASDWEKPLFAALWLYSGYTITVANMTGLITMPLVAALAAGLTWTRMKVSVQSTDDAIAIGN
jgi:hypothetical protein